MAWVVDTCVLIDVLVGDPEFGERSAALIDRHLPQGILVCPVTYAELAPAFGGNLALQNEFLDALGAQYRLVWGWQETEAAHQAWHRFVALRRRAQVPKKPLADILIGAFASAHSGLLTRNGSDFAAVFSNLVIRAA